MTIRSQWCSVGRCTGTINCSYSHRVLFPMCLEYVVFRPVDVMKDKSRKLQIPTAFLQIPDYFSKIQNTSSRCHQSAFQRRLFNQCRLPTNWHCLFLLSSLIHQGNLHGPYAWHFVCRWQSLLVAVCHFLPLLLVT